MWAQLGGIPDGHAGTEATIRVMAELAASPSEGGRDPEIVALARKIVEGIPSKDYLGELNAIFNFVKENVRYVQDPRGLEHVETPRRTLLVTGQEDCDGHATCLAALAIALNHGVAFRTLAADRSRPGEWSHVYAVLGYRDRQGVHWYAADTTQAESSLGWEPGEGYAKRDWLVVDA